MKTQYSVGVGVVALGVGIAANAVLGPLALRVIRFHNSVSGVNQLVGGEAVSLIVVAPLSVAAGILWIRGRAVAPALALAPSLYALYTSTTLVLGPEYQRYPGNNERYLPLHLGILILGGYIAVQAWSALGAARPSMPGTGLRVTTATTLLIPNALFALAWIKQIAAFASGERSQAYQDDPRLWWLIKALDLSLVIPASLAVGVGLLRQRPVASKAAYGLAGFLACLLGSIGSMGAMQIWNDDPAASPVLVGVAGFAALGAGSVAARLVRAYVVQAASREEPAVTRQDTQVTTA